jgi:hypothetical protein
VVADVTVICEPFGADPAALPRVVEGRQRRRVRRRMPARSMGLTNAPAAT